MSKLRVRVPATSANLGPGYDCLGVALALHLEVTCEPAPAFALQLSGEGVGELPRDATNLLVRALQTGLGAGAAGAEAAPAAAALPAVRLSVANAIPLARGLGSSAAATVAGLALGQLLAGRAPAELDRQQLIEQATRFEGHPDNAAPAVLGDLVISGIEDGTVIALRESWPEDLRLVAVVPELTIATERARQVLPARVAFAEAVAGSARLARLLAALRARRYELLAAALADRLHQPHRLRLGRGLADVLAVMTAHDDALGAYLSGSGPTLVALCRDGGERIGRAAVGAFAEHGVSAAFHVLPVDRRGLAGWRDP